MRGCITVIDEQGVESTYPYFPWPFPPLAGVPGLWKYDTLDMRLLPEGGIEVRLPRSAGTTEGDSRPRERHQESESEVGRAEESDKDA